MYLEFGFLFSNGELEQVISNYQDEIRREVQQWEPNKILASSETDLIAYFVEKYTLDVPRLIPEQKYVLDHGETQIDVTGRIEYFNPGHNPLKVPGHFVTVAIPFQGDEHLFQFRASTRSLSPLRRSQIRNGLALVTLRDVELDAAKVQQEISDEIEKISKNLDWLRNDCKTWNLRIPSLSEDYIHERKERLLAQSNMIRALGLPVQKREGSANSVVNVTRKKRLLAVPRTPVEPFTPEPEISNSTYNEILATIDLLSQNIERSPSAFSKMREEVIRDLLLVSLNGQYEWDAIGEAFNGEGKTDILIQEKGRNVFIAECKFWNGEKALKEAIDQLLGYLTWRDTKAALIVFSKKKNFTNTLAGLNQAVHDHPKFMKQLQNISETHTRYLFRQKHDPNRDLYLAVQAFNIPNVE